MGFCEILTIVFVVLKLLGVVSWSWWLVFLPEIIAVVIYVGIFIVNLLIWRSWKKEADDMFKNHFNF